MHFVRQPWNYMDLVLGANGNIGMGTDDPKAKLSVVGTAMISDGSGYVVPQEHMASGSLTIGSTATSYGGGSGLNANTAGLMLETSANTEIAVHDGGTRVASLMYFEGDAANRITIGRDMGWGTTPLVAAGGIGIGTANPEARLHLVNVPTDAHGNTLIIGQTSASHMRLGYHDDYTWIQSHCGRPLSLNPVGNNVGIGTTVPSHRFHVVADNAVGLFESSGEMAYLRLSTKEGLDNRVEIANRPGGRLSLWNNGQDVFNITRDGNVGIGTTTPNQKLTVQGGHNAGRDPDSGLLYGGQLAIKGNVCQLDFINTNHAGWAIHVNSLNKMYFVRAPWNSSDLVLDGSGNIGIGTDSPAQQLTITGGLGFANQNAGDKKLYSPNDGLLEWMTNDAAGEHGFAVSHQGQARVYFNTNGNSYLNGGNVGIGTTNPNAKLHIVDVPQEADGHTLIIGQTDASNMRLGCHNDYTWIQSHNSRHLVLNPQGNNVGIGTSAPTHMFHVVADGGLFESSSDSAYLRLATKDGLDKRVEIIHRPGGRLSLWNNGEDVLNITRNGNVGIGTITPSEKLQVSGNLNVSGDIIRRVSMATGLGPDDQTDTGPIASRVLSFVKRYADTAIRIIYCDNFRVNGNNVAARWEIRIDGGSPPGGAIYQDKYGSTGNYHEPGVIMGYARGITAGVHVIGVWVSTPPNYPVCDAYTGWGSSRWTLEAQEVWL